jgi:ribosomal peptide maturation radical SAM protein 1
LWTEWHEYEIPFKINSTRLDLKYLKDLFKQIHEKRLDYNFAWEIKANLTREQLRTMNLGGMKFLQPGIESLNTHILQLMRKGCTMLQNLVTLKWCRYYGIGVLWNLLYGFPGERKEDFLRETAILKLISHLEPPAGCGRIWLERFSPYFFDREKFPVTNIRPESSYAYVYPPNVLLERIAYSFDYEMGETVPESVHSEKKDWVKNWNHKWNANEPDALSFSSKNNQIQIRDRRTMLNQSGKIPTNYELSGTSAWIYEFCSDTYRTVRQIQEEQDKMHIKKCSEKTIQETLDLFCNLGLTVSEDGKYFSLALPERVAD